VLLSEVFDNYIRDIVLFSGQSSSTAGHVRRTKKRLLSCVGDIDIGDLSFEQIVKFKTHIEQTCGVNGTRQFIIKLRNVLRYARQRGITCIDYDTIKLPKVQVTKVSFCTPEEVTRLISACAHTKLTMHRLRDRAIISLLYASGLRLSELCGLNIDQINETRRFTVIGKNGKQRLCFFDERSERYMNEYIKARREGYKVYWTYKGKPSKEVRRYYPPDTNEALFINCITGRRIQASGVQLLFTNVARIAGMRHIHPHVLRHSFATNMMENNAPLHTVSRMMGHSSVAVTSIYLHTVDNHLQEDHAKYHTI